MGATSMGDTSNVEETTGKEQKELLEKWFENHGTTSKCGTLENALCVGITNNTKRSDIKKLGVIKLKTPVDITTKQNENEVTAKYTCLIFNYGYIRKQLPKAKRRLKAGTGRAAQRFLSDLRGYAARPSSIGLKVDVDSRESSGTRAVVVPWKNLGEKTQETCRRAKCSVFWENIGELETWEKRVTEKKGGGFFGQQKSARAKERELVAAYLAKNGKKGWWRDKPSGTWFWWETCNAQMALRAVRDAENARGDCYSFYPTCGTARCAGNGTAALARFVVRTDGVLYRGLRLLRDGGPFGTIVHVDTRLALCALDPCARTDDLPREVNGWDYGFDNYHANGGVLLPAPRGDGGLVFTDGLFFGGLDALSDENVIVLMSNIFNKAANVDMLKRSFEKSGATDKVLDLARAVGRAGNAEDCDGGAKFALRRLVDLLAVSGQRQLAEDALAAAGEVAEWKPLASTAIGVLDGWRGFAEPLTAGLFEEMKRLCDFVKSQEKECGCWFISEEEKCAEKLTGWVSQLGVLVDLVTKSRSSAMGDICSAHQWLASLQTKMQTNGREYANAVQNNDSSLLGENDWDLLGKYERCAARNVRKACETLGKACDYIARALFISVPDDFEDVLSTARMLNAKKEKAPGGANPADNNYGTTTVAGSGEAESPQMSGQPGGGWNGRADSGSPPDGGYYNPASFGDSTCVAVADPLGGAEGVSGYPRDNDALPMYYGSYNPDGSPGSFAAGVCSGTTVSNKYGGPASYNVPVAPVLGEAGAPLATTAPGFAAPAGATNVLGTAFGVGDGALLGSVESIEPTLGNRMEDCVNSLTVYIESLEEDCANWEDAYDGEDNIDVDHYVDVLDTAISALGGVLGEKQSAVESAKPREANVSLITRKWVDSVRDTLDVALTALKNLQAASDGAQLNSGIDEVNNEYIAELRGAYKRLHQTRDELYTGTDREQKGSV